jgi:hypothetical protein
MLLGIALRFLNASGLMSGYNSMNEIEKKKWKEKF